MARGTVRGGVRRWVDSAWRALTALAGGVVAALRADSERVVSTVLGRHTGETLHAQVTFRALTDAVVPETPALGDELGPEHVPGGLAIGLDDFLRTYVQHSFQFGTPHLGPQGNLPLVEPIAHALDFGALGLLVRGENELPPREDRPASLLDPGEASPRSVERAAGPFSKLSRRDRLRAIHALDELELAVSPLEGELFEFDAGLVGQLAVGFAELIYYSEWQGYDEFRQSPRARTHPNDPAAVQSWRQTRYPGFADGYAALRGYLGSEAGSLGDGEVWATIDSSARSPVRITHEPGAFRENDYDTSDYTEPYPE